MFGLPHTVTLLTTNRCTANCHSCGVGATPTGSKRLSLQTMRKYIDEAAELGVRLIVFSGGEPFLLGNDLTAAVRHATSAGLLTRFVSNAYWSTSRNTAFECLVELKKAGLCEVNFSTGKNHQHFVPVKNVINGVLTAIELEMTCAVMIELHEKNSYTTDDFLAEEELSVILENPETRGRLVVLESPWVDVTKDASKDLGKFRLLTTETLGHRTGCTSIIGGIAVSPDENLGACCGITCNHIPELTVGSLKRSSMAELIDLMKRDFIKRWLFAQGPEHILAWAAEHDPGIVWEGRYSHQCHACYAVYNSSAVRKVVAEHYNKKLLDVSFQCWMMSKYVDRYWDRAQRLCH